MVNGLDVPFWVIDGDREMEAMWRCIVNEDHAELDRTVDAILAEHVRRDKLRAEFNLSPLPQPGISEMFVPPETKGVIHTDISPAAEAV